MLSRPVRPHCTTTGTRETVFAASIFTKHSLGPVSPRRVRGLLSVLFVSMISNRKEKGKGAWGHGRHQRRLVVSGLVPRVGIYPLGHKRPRLDGLADLPRRSVLAKFDELLRSHEKQFLPHRAHHDRRASSTPLYQPEGHPGAAKRRARHASPHSLRACLTMACPPSSPRRLPHHPRACSRRPRRQQRQAR